MPDESPKPDEIASTDADKPAYELEPAPATPIVPPPKSDAVKRAIELEKQLEREAMERRTSVHDDEDDEDAEVSAANQPLLDARLTNSNFYFGLAGVLTVAAAWIGAANVTDAKQSELAVVVSTVYNTALHAGTGLVAAWCWAKIEARPLGSWRDVLARMSVAVASAWLFFNMQLGLDVKLEEPLLGIASYLCVLILLMRWTPKRAFRVACVHFALILVVFLAMVLHVWASRGA
ncbi:MAG TPA: hypothetical protein VK157_06170 [Phycisphaerales bacterium]|nr:hypothetical protein [Phycisphaerales bacterium]